MYVNPVIKGKVDTMSIVSYTVSGAMCKRWSPRKEQKRDMKKLYFVFF